MKNGRILKKGFFCRWEGMAQPHVWQLYSLVCSLKELLFPNILLWRKPNLIATVLDKAKKLLKLHPRYWKIQIGKKIIKGLKRIRVRRIVKNIGKNIKGLGKKIGKVWRKVGSKVRRTVRRITRRLRRVVRVRVRLPRVRVRLPRVRLPRVRVRLPRIRTPRVRFRFGRRRRWGKKKRSPCSDCERMSEMSEDDQLNSCKV